jgi:DNA-binding NtrC family response regulator
LEIKESMMHPARVLIVDDEKDILKALEFLLRAEGYAVSLAASGEEALELYRKEGFDIVLTDLKMPGMDGLTLLEEIRKLNPDATVLFMSAYATVESAVEAMKRGAADYIVKPFINEEVKLTFRRLIESLRLKEENLALKRELSQHRGRCKELVFNSEAMAKLFDMLDSVIPTKSNVLLTGESGTGKGAIAELVHCNSPRRDRAFISINCSAIPEGLLESELFGYKRGAFTGANSDKKGLIELAHEGTLFLDEIGDMPPALQAKLLKVLESGEVQPLGGTKSRHVDIRLVSATNQDLDKKIKAGIFREDLYYRISVFEVCIPPLRERTEDIPLLVDYFIKKYSAANGKDVKGVSEPALEMLISYKWPGNVRELSNVIERAVVLARGDTIGPEQFPEKLKTRDEMKASSLKEAVCDVERNIILKALQDHRRNKEAAAQSLGIDLVTLYRKMKKLGIE